MEKFQAIKISLKEIPTKAYFVSNLMIKLIKLNDIYRTVLKVLAKNLESEFINSSLANCFIYERNYFGSNITLSELIENEWIHTNIRQSVQTK